MGTTIGSSFLWMVPEANSTRCLMRAIGTTGGTIYSHLREVKEAWFGFDGGDVLTVSSSTGYVFSSGDSAPRLIIPGVSMIRPSPTQSVFAVVQGSNVVVRRLADGDTVAVLPYKKTVTDLRFNTAGNIIATACDDSTAKLWNAQTGSLLYTLGGHSGLVAKARFCQDGSHLLTQSYGMAKVWSVVDGTLTRSLTIKNLLYTSLSSDGRFLLTTVTGDSLVSLWNVSTGELIRTFGAAPKKPLRAWFTPDDSQVVGTSEDSSISTVWDAHTGALLHVLDHNVGGVNYFSYSIDGRCLATVDAKLTINLWDAHTGEFLRSFVGHRQRPGFGNAAVNTANFSNDGRFLVTAGIDSTARVWPLELDEQHASDTSDAFFTIWPATAAVARVAFDTLPVHMHRDTVVTALLRNPAPAAAPVTALSITGPQASSFAVVAGPSSIPAEGAADLQIRYWPQSAGAQSATLVAVVGGDTGRVSLRGDAIIWPLVRHVDSVDLGVVPAGTSRDTLVDLVENVTEAPVEIDSLRFMFGTFLYGISPNRSMTVAPHGYGSALIHYNRQVTFRVGDTLLVYHQGLGSPLKIAVVVTGQAAAGVDEAAGGSGAWLSCSPNPAGRRVALRYGVPRSCHVRVSVWDAVGREVLVVSEGEEQRGEHVVELDVHGLRPGMYYGVVDVGGARVVEGVRIVR
jgi:WD40 repeat protein